MKIRLDTTLQGNVFVKEDLQLIDESTDTWTEWVVFSDNSDVAESIYAEGVIKLMRLAYEAGKRGEEFTVERDIVNETTEKEEDGND